MCLFINVLYKWFCIRLHFGSLFSLMIICVKADISSYNNNNATAFGLQLYISSQGHVFTEVLH